MAQITPSDSTLIPLKSNTTVFSAWRISFAGALIILVLLPILIPDPFAKILPFLFDGLLRTFQVTFLSMLFALIIGLLSGLGQISRIRVLNLISTIYVEVVRGIPLLVQLFYIYYALGRVVQVPRLAAAVIAMAVCYGAYLSEVFRAGILSIPKGQMEASLALGLSRWKSLQYVIFPQTLKIMLPPIGNEFIALLKDSSLVSILAVSDLLRRGREYAAVTFNYFETYTMVALLYLVTTLFLSKIVAILEEKVSLHGTS